MKTKLAYVLLMTIFGSLLHAEVYAVGVVGAVKGKILHDCPASNIDGQLLKPGDTIYMTSIMTKVDPSSFFSMVSADGKVKVFKQFSANQFSGLTILDKALVQNLASSIAGSSARTGSRTVVSPLFKWASGLGRIAQPDIDQGIMQLRLSLDGSSLASGSYMPLTFQLSRQVGSFSWRLLSQEAAGASVAMILQGDFIREGDDWSLDFRALGKLIPDLRYTLELVAMFPGRPSQSVSIPFTIVDIAETKNIEAEIAHRRSIAAPEFLDFTSASVWSEYGFDLRRLESLRFLTED